MNKLKYKLASFDIDETLIHNGVLTNTTKEALIRLHNSGCKIAVNTGRSIYIVFEELKDFYIDYLICCNGSIVYDNTNKKIIYCEHISQNARQFLAEQAKNSHNLKIKCDEQVYVGSFFPIKSVLFDLKYTPNYRFNLRQKLYYWSTLDMKHNIKEILLNSQSLLKLEWACNTPNEAKNQCNTLNNNPYLRSNVTGTNYIEVVSSKASKGIAIEWLCDYLNIDKSESIAFGDSGNDIDALKSAGYAVAMGNATKEAKMVADIVIDTAAKNGVASFIDTLL